MNRSVKSLSNSSPGIAVSDMLVRINQLEVEIKSEIAQCRRQLASKEVVRRSVPTKIPRSPSSKAVLTRARSLDGIGFVGTVPDNTSGFATIPEELLYRICREFNAFQLCQARLICRRWSRIIGASSLMDKLKIRLPSGCILKSNCEEVLALAASRYTKVVLERSMIHKPVTWWPMVSGSLHTLTLSYCNVTAEELLGMLRLTPTLRNLTLDVHFGSSLPEVNFQLVSLKKLNIQSIVEPEWYKMFKNMCPGLRILALPYIEKDCTPNVLDFIRSLGDTLEHLSIQGGDDKFWTNLPQELGNIRLKRFTSGIKDSRQLAKLIQTQPSIEELILTAVHDADLELGKTLPNLKRLELLVKDIPEGKPLLDNLQPLEHLKLESIEYCKPKLNVNWSKNFPNLHSLKLKSFDLKDWQTFFEDCTRLKNLKSLQLISLQASCEIPNFNVPKQAFKSVKISNCKFPPHFIKQLLHLCPNLEEICLERTSDINDSTIQKLLQSAKRLRSLAVTTCKITETSVEHLIDQGDAIEKVRIWNCGKIPHNSWQRLRKHRNVQILYKM